MALYARVSTADKDQDPLTQLMPLRDYCQAQGWGVFREYTDTASASDLRHRTAWRELLDDAARRYFQGVIVWKLDRAFRSVKDMHDSLAMWEPLGITFHSQREQFDTSTAIGRLLLNLLASLAEFELEMIRERVRAGMDRARRQGKHIGRPPRMAEKGFKARWEDVRARLASGEIPSRRKAAVELGVGYPTLKRLLEKEDHD